nr:hypothetical protein [uncultured Nocardioides sp.]
MQDRGERQAVAARGERGHGGPDGQPRLEDAARHLGVELALAHQEARQQVESGVPLEVAHGRGPAVPHLDQAGGRHPLQRLSDRRPRDPEHLGQSAFAGQGLPGADLPVDDLAQHLVEDLVGDRSALNRLQRHVLDPAWLMVRGQVVRPDSP